MSVVRPPSPQTFSDRTIRTAAAVLQFTPDVTQSFGVKNRVDSADPVWDWPAVVTGVGPAGGGKRLEFETMTDMFRRRARWAGGCLMAVAVVGVTVGHVQAFYFGGWPGDGLPKTRTLLPENAPKEGSPPSAQLREERPPPDTFKDERENPTVVPPTETPETPPPVVPEPTTVALAGLGIGVAVLARWRRRG
jgi:hypothetical protein